MNVTTLTNEQIHRNAPSVFAVEPWHKQSDKYRFIPTAEVVNALRDSGFSPVSVTQSRSRIEGKQEFTKHMLRFRQASGLLTVGDVIPEVVLVNSHDGTSSYVLMMGLFRCICSNQAVVSEAQIGEVRVRHMGGRDLCQQVIDASFKLIEEAPKVIGTVNRWEGLMLTAPEQNVLAEAALEVAPSTLKVETSQLLRSRRYADDTQANGDRNLWKTYNVIQENIIRGGIGARNEAGRRMRTREIKGIDSNVGVNKALWTLTSKMAELKNQN